MMQLVVPKQNGRQKYVVRLDIKANERRGSRFPISSPLSAASAERGTLICKDILAELAADQPPHVAGGFGGAFVIATIVHGVASLPIEASYLELGPVLDLDYLDWRSKRPAARDGTVLTLSKTAARAIRDTYLGRFITMDWRICGFRGSTRSTYFRYCQSSSERCRSQAAGKGLSRSSS
jgi:hypothetical protein